MALFSNRVPLSGEPKKAMSKSLAPRRPIRSYVIRSGRLTDSQKNAIEQYWERYVLAFEEKPLILEDIFARRAKLTVEIGFGMGDSLLQMACDNRDVDYIGIEVHRPGVGKLLHGIAENQLSNIRIICHDAKDVLEQALLPGSIDRLQIFFPDPWPKKRHHKRRLVQSAFIDLASSRLSAEGAIHLATDVDAYAEHMMEVMEAVSTLENAIAARQYWPTPARPQTKFERRGKKLGHGVWDLLFQKRAESGL